jgi:serine/threonine-protein kinase
VNPFAQWLARHRASGEQGLLRADAIEPGTLLGGVRIDERLGAGNHATVYAATDEASGLPCAIKVQPADPPGLDAAAQDAARARFLEDGERATRLVHPAIVRVFGGGISRGVAFVVMERAPGRSLERHTRADRLLPEPLVLDIAARLAEALAHAHRQGLAHRDVKPANVLFHLVSGSVKLADFGLARAADAQATRSGVLLGSPQYMAPELLAGAPADAASDLYALGVLAYELLTGSLPFSGRSMGELLRAVAQEAPASVALARHDLAPAQAEALDALLAPLLAKDHANRLADGGAFAARVRALQARWPACAAAASAE